MRISGRKDVRPSRINVLDIDPRSRRAVTVFSPREDKDAPPHHITVAANAPNPNGAQPNLSNSEKPAAIKQAWLTPTFLRRTVHLLND